MVRYFFEYLMLNVLHRQDWNRVAAEFSTDEYQSVISEILIWRERVPSLPVGVEATLYLFQALIYDDPSQEFISEEQARSLYSLAIIRYLVEQDNVVPIQQRVKKPA